MQETDNYASVNVAYLKDIRSLLNLEDIVIMRKSKSGELNLFPKEQLSLVMNDFKYENLTLYIPIKIIEYVKELREKKDESVVFKKSFKNPEEAERSMTKRIIEISKMPYQEKVDIVSGYKKELQSLGKDVKIDNNVAEKIINVGHDVNLITKVNMFDSLQKIRKGEMGLKDIKEQNKEISAETDTLISSIVEMMSKNIETQKAFTEIENYSDGGIMAHCNRVFVMFINFLTYYNYCINNVAMVPKIRTKFPSKYIKYYIEVQNFMSADEVVKKNINMLEDCFDNGMAAIENQSVVAYSVGAFLHDIGKVKDIDYFEGPFARDLDRIKKHLFNSYALVSQTTDYPKEVVYTVGLHHEYYGHGYGPFSELYKQKKIKHSSSRFSTIVTYSADVIANCNAMAYFPAKILEIVDVYDALMDPARKYRGGKTFTSLEALNIIRDDFIKKEVKVDPILFDMFVDFIAYTNSDKSILESQLVK